MKVNGSIALAAMTAAGFTVSAQTAQQRPNILFFLVDDMGWMDCTVNGSEYYETPNMERLARQGMVFTAAYSASPLSSPTRASILTGRYPERFHLTNPNGHRVPNPNAPLIKEEDAPWKRMIEPTPRNFMPLEEVTLAEMLQTAGYTTAHIGKWHLGQRRYWADKQGFDVTIASEHHPGPPNFFSPYRISTFEDGPEHEYLTDRLTDEALAYLDAHKDKRFFLNFWHYAVHAPFQGKKELIAKYEAKTDPRGKQRCPVMGAMIESVDMSLGRVMDKLEELGIADNTLIIFFSDNGGNRYNLVNGVFPTNNYPLRMGKGNIHEGGVRVPMIVSWPGHVPAGERTDRIVSSVDFFPTLAALTGAQVDPDIEIDGQNILSLWFGEENYEHQPIFTHFPHYVIATDNYPSTSVRTQDWKLIRTYGEGDDGCISYELYRMDGDIGERHNLANKEPGIVGELDALICEHLVRTKATVPVPNPAYDPQAKNPMGRRVVFPVEKFPNF